MATLAAVMTCQSNAGSCDRDEGGEPPHLILDIDVSTSRTFDPTSDADAIWTEFDRLREIKNDCFFSSLEKETWKAYL